QPFADASDRHVAIVQHAAEDALIDVDAFHLVEAHLESAAFDETGLVHHPQICDVGLGGPDVEPSLRRRNHRDQRCRGCQHQPHQGIAPPAMGRLVMKFGGTSVATIERIRNVARHVQREVDAGHEVAVVVSAMAGKTNELVEWCREASPMHDAREYDAVVASGEQVTAGLLAIILQGFGIQARSWQGWQIPIKTSDAHASARILEIDGSELINRFKERKEVAVIAGFQGIYPATGRITTLGRGGSDTSAVAIAAAIHATRCDIYTDVDGVYTTDPRVVPKARRLNKIAFEDMLELASQ